jgi:acetoin utilization deacetylase AcuC-like enzyme
MRVVYTPAHLGHDPVSETLMGRETSAYEVPERAELIRATLAADGGFELGGPTDHGLEPILAIHDPGLVRFLEEAWSQAEREGIDRAAVVPDTWAVRGLSEGFGPEGMRLVREPVAIAGRAGFWGLDSSTPIVAGTYLAARGAVDTALTAVDVVLDGGETTVYGLCRPPGHHAARSMYAGYCFFNNAAIAAESIVRRTGERVAILDLDYHHGNGTEQIFWRRGDVLYVSIHADPDRQYPYVLGRADETGEGPGAGANVNLPLEAGVDDRRYLEVLDRALEAIAATAGSVVVVSLGFDTYREDPICDFALTTPVYHEIGRRVAALGRRLVVLQEGGYHRPTLGENARTWLRGVDGRPAEPALPSTT